MSCLVTFHKFSFLLNDPKSGIGQDCSTNCAVHEEREEEEGERRSSAVPSVLGAVPWGQTDHGNLTFSFIRSIFYFLFFSWFKTHRIMVSVSSHSWNASFFAVFFKKNSLLETNSNFAVIRANCRPSKHRKTAARRSPKCFLRWRRSCIKSSSRRRRATLVPSSTSPLLVFHAPSKSSVSCTLFGTSSLTGSGCPRLRRRKVCRMSVWRPLAVFWW